MVAATAVEVAAALFGLGTTPVTTLLQMGAVTVELTLLDEVAEETTLEETAAGVEATRAGRTGLVGRSEERNLA